MVILTYRYIPISKINIFTRFNNYRIFITVKEHLSFNVRIFAQAKKLPYQTHIFKENSIS
ncbi:hypothetical protein WSO01_15440 [Weissella soli]|nr:hypothetical protein WSO01_15440 [Weissella soli]